SYTFPTGTWPSSIPNLDHMAVMGGKSWNAGQILHKNVQNLSTVGFVDNQVVKLELDQDKGTLTFFIAEKQQPVYIYGIKVKVRFIKIAAPTSKHVANERAIQW
ncbi:MAG: hypothetical protein EZS28_022317, partial [Streblomastix strix]